MLAESSRTIGRRATLALLAFAAVLVGGCASLQRLDPVTVIMAGVEPLHGEGLEVRMLVKLRIQNPNAVPIDFDGVSVQLDVQGKPFASGVSGAGGSVPRFGEAIVSVPVSISVFRIARQAIGVMTHEYRGRLAYEMTGKLAGPAFDSVRFKSKGEFVLPAEILEGAR
jgi:LEA14-like dessication related protein